MSKPEIKLGHIVKLFLWKYFKFLRPSNVTIKGKLIFNRYSQIIIDAYSNLIIEGDLEIGFSSFNLINSSFISGDMVCRDSRIQLDSSQVKLGASAHIKRTQFSLIQTVFNAKEQCRIHSIQLTAIESSFEIGSYFFAQHKGEGAIIWSCTKSKLIAGNNVRMQCAFFQNDASFSIGSNSFINSGTSISCINEISIGNYVLISYDCLIFDNNSHALDYRIRRQEIDYGFPNGTAAEKCPKPQNAPIHIFDDVWIGARSTILKGVSIKSQSIVASNTVVTKNVDASTMVYGSPNQYKPIVT
jgi:acetyltransferase-like isoleucine patch superfamily enzyme